MLLCYNCHKYVSGVQKSRSLDEVRELINKGILKIPETYLKEFTN